MSCQADIYYFAEPTDPGSSYSAQNWLARLFVEDSTGLSDIDTTLGNELMTLYGLSIDTSSIDFGSLAAGANTGAVNAQTIIYNTGNSSIDIRVSGTDLAGTGSSIGVGEQKYATTTFAYGACAICQFLTGSASDVEVDLPKAVATSTPSSDDLYWGLNVPLNTGAVVHTGVNTFIATSD
jgi:hypothetical protein